MRRWSMAARAMAGVLSLGLSASVDAASLQVSPTSVTLQAARVRMA